MATAVLCGLALAATANAAGPRQAGSFAYTSTTPGTPTGIEVQFDFRNPDDPNVKPPAVARMVIQTPPGGVIDTGAVPQCHAPDAVLLVEGPDGCPADTKVGGGYVLTPSAAGRSRTTISDFNSDGGVIGIGVNDDIPAIRTVDHTRFDANTSTTDFPVFPGLPPPDPYTPIETIHELFPARVDDGRPYAVTPPTCPPAGYWTITSTFTYHDGDVESVESHSPCQP